MLGFGGHFLTKARRYSIRFHDLRQARIIYRRTHDAGPEHGPIRAADHADEETTLIIGTLTYAGTGWTTQHHGLKGVLGFDERVTWDSVLVWRRGGTPGRRLGV